ncbi:hypothetical protein ACHAQJ_003049 [Trichoderma viride]
MASPRQTPCPTESRETIARESQPPQPEPPPPPILAVPRRVQELKEPKDSSRKRLNARSKQRVSKDHRRTHLSHWREEVVSNLEGGDSFSTRIAILKILRRIPELRDHVVQLVSNNPVARTYTVRYTRRELVQFEDEARWRHLSYDNIRDLKRQLFNLVKLMYKHGVGYKLYPHHLYLYRPVSGERTSTLFLGSVTHSDLLDTGKLDWDEQKERIWSQINRIFTPVEVWAYQEEAANLAAYVKEQMDSVESTINDNNIAIDAAKTDLTEARAVMMGAFKIIKEACANVEGLKAVTKNLEASVIRPSCAWNDAQVEKEYVETSLKKIDVLTGRANALIQKYGNPKPSRGVSTGECTASPSITPEDMMSNTKDTNSPADDAKAIEEVTT